MKKSSLCKIYYSLLIVLCTSEVTFGWLWSQVVTPNHKPPPKPKPIFLSFKDIHEFKTCEAHMKIKYNLLFDCIMNCENEFMTRRSGQYTIYNRWPGVSSLMERCSACRKLFLERSENCDKLFDCKKRVGGAFCSRCSSDTFSCNGRVCIPKRWKCDKIVDCLNGEDEKNCEFRACTKNEFRCENDRCIDQSQYCNGKDDCGDRSDEKRCPKKDNSNNFECQSVYCNIIDDCGDRSDEKTCSILNYSNSFDCQRLFIPSNWHCDGVIDCHNGLDEKNCPPTKNCTDNQFKCDNRKCIHVDSVCDGVADCWDRSDEKNCNSTKCAQNQFDCGDQCIPLQWRCDKRKDCLNLKDEMNCNTVMYKSYRLDSDLECVEGTFPCADKSGCISNDFVCDKYPNCKDHSDEMNCPGRNDLV